MEDVVLFDSWGGQFSDNPRAVSEALHARDPDLRQLWVLGDETEGPAWADRVRAGGDEHVERLERARFIVTNNLLPPFRKAPGTTLVQTWHGTPFKRIGFDLPDADPGYLEHLGREAHQWDLLLSPNPVSTPRLRSAFRYDGPVLESGYPRNDALAGSGAGGDTVLYAPTFRELGTFTSPLDEAAIGDRLVVRPHHMTGAEEQADLRDQLLDAAVLITDYSSVMFDFAITGRPIICLVPDRDRYRREHGFYFELEASPPGAIVTSTDEVVAALADPAPPSEAFRRTFCALEDGGASDRVIDAMLSARR